MCAQLEALLADFGEACFTSVRREQSDPGLFGRLYDLIPAGLIDAAAEDSELAALFGEPGELGAFVHLSNGSGHRLSDARLLLVGCVESAAERLRATDGFSDEPARFGAEVVDDLNAFRRMVRGEPVEVIQLFGIQGLALEEADGVVLPWGRLRPLRLGEGLARLPSGHSFGHGATGTAILVSSASLKAVVGEPEDVGPLFPEPSDIELKIALAAGLADVNDEGPRGCAVVWSTQIIPSEPLSQFTFRLAVSPLLGSRTLSSADATALADWASLVERVGTRDLDLVVRRFVSSMQERLRPDDALIDAVIAAEALFGHGQATEVGFRVTAALALLLERDPAKRAAFRKRLAKAYNVRSTIVHGGRPTPDDVLQSRDLAMTTLRSALRVLYRDRQDLVTDPERGLKLLLGAA